MPPTLYRDAAYADARSPRLQVGVSLLVDDTPLPCSGYDNRDSNWQDSVLDRGWVGDFYVWADLDCCENPVGSETSTWGALKTRYR